MTTATDRDARDKRLVVYTWIALTATTLLAWRLSPGHGDAATALGKELIAGIVVLGAVKCRLIIGNFMEIRHAPRALRIALDIWLVVLWAALFGIYLYST
ncbi:cytochrome C oxidase subunit IV family protein [Nocardia bovistercoris]|uniref:Cytochrome C oxidase subunit IV family protein n=1 Tax=Nocardia bovistercoris TaxID=2785916 RepID=A0A931N109_9NOCA|nr:cytochrome C oxidase subunit IV family protein [Nocardia bovistercoris]